MKQEEINHFKSKLEEELKNVTSELGTVGRINPDNPHDWEPVPEASNGFPADPNEAADTFESFEENTAILKQLEIRVNEITEALQRIAQGKFGTCKVCTEPIEKDRLEANPAAKTCKKHMNG